MDTSRFEKFTKEAKQALIVAQEKARDAKLNYVGTEHVLLGILTQESSLGASILVSFGVSLENVNLVLKTVGRMSPVANNNQKGWGGLSGFAKKVIEDAVHIAQEFNHAYVGTEHMLFALVSQENTAATVILENMKINPVDIKEQIIQTFEKAKESQRNNGSMPYAQNAMNPLEFFLSGLHGVLVGNMEKDQQSPYQKTKKEERRDGDERLAKTPALDYFTVDLVAECRNGKLTPVVGRAKEIERTISILCRKTKNNPVLIGEPGVGKTAIADGLAHAIVNEQVPDHMMDKRILSLSMTSVVAGTKYRGEFEERIKQIIDEASSQHNVILFIDELHTVIGAGSAEGSLDAANILKPALSRGRVQIIGATTNNEYRKHIETDAALERRFQPVRVDEPTEEETLLILQGLREGLEEHHNLVITDEALQSAVTLSKRYVNDRYLPDKAIDLVDEAGSLKRIKSKINTDRIRKIQKELSKIIKAKEESVATQNYEHAAELRNRELELLNELEASKVVKIPREQREKVTEEDIARVVSQMTGVPVTRLVTEDIAHLMNLETALHKRIVGQKEAVEAVSKAIRRSRVGFSDHNRPIGSFIFLGPTGVGKTELVKALAQEVFHDKNAFIRIDMSEFMERHNTARLVGAPAGYVGYEDGGQLTEAVRRKPYSVVLFDEIEKAHPEVFNLLLQILEDGKLTDSKGRSIDFKNTIIVMTSNIGGKKLTDKAGPIGFQLTNKELKEAEQDFNSLKDDVLRELKDHFRPEFLNRVDKVIVFNPLTHDDVKEVVKLQIGYLQERLKPKKLAIELTSGAIEIFANVSYDPLYGARHVRRKIQELIEDPLTISYLKGEFIEGDAIQVYQKGDTIELRKDVGNGRDRSTTAASKKKGKKIMEKDVKPVSTSA